MREFAVVWSLKRGSIRGVEVLDFANQYLANVEAERASAQEREILMHRATHRAQWERDPLLTREELLRLHGKHGNSAAAHAIARVA